MRLAFVAVAALTLSACSLTIDCKAGGVGTSCALPPEFVYVLNQGSPAGATGGLARYDRTGRIEGDSTGPLGVLFQHAAGSVYDGRLYVTAPAADRIEVFGNGSPIVRVGRIAVVRPRYVALVSEAKAYVTTQPEGGPSAVVVVDPRSGATVRTVGVGGRAEGIAVAGARAYVATGAGGASHEVVVLDTATDAVVDRIDVGCAPRLVLAETSLGPATPDVFVVCAGTDADGVVVLDGPTGAVRRRLAVGGAVSAATGQVADLTDVADPAYGAPGLALYVARADGTVALVPADGGAVATLRVGGAPIGGVATDAVSGWLLVAHVPGPTATGYVTTHTPDGEEVARRSSGGVAPGQLFFPAFTAF